jgi:hypothetical protein
MGRVWCLGGSAVGVPWYWIEMGVRVRREPGAGAVLSLCVGVKEDLVDGAGWVLLECRGQMSESAWVYGPVRCGMWGPLETEGVS